jgi:hypothetical protein
MRRREGAARPSLTRVVCAPLVAQFAESAPPFFVLEATNTIPLDFQMCAILYRFANWCCRRLTSSELCGPKRSPGVVCSNDGAAAMLRHFFLRRFCIAKTDARFIFPADCIRVVRVACVPSTKNGQREQL